jgi:hypothetical protein
MLEWFLLPDNDHSLLGGVITRAENSSRVTELYWSQSLCAFDLQSPLSAWHYRALNLEILKTVPVNASPGTEKIVEDMDDRRIHCRRTLPLRRALYAS